MGKINNYLSSLYRDQDNPEEIFGMTENKITPIMYENITKEILSLAQSKDYEELVKKLENLKSYCDPSVDIMRLAKNLCGRIYHNGFCDSQALIWIEEYIEKLLKQEKEYIPISKIYVDWYLHRNTIRGISTLCRDLDMRTGGLLPGTLCTVAGGPGCMKTTYSMNISYQAIKDGYNVCYMSLEEPKEILYSKLLARVSVDVGKEISTNEILQNKLDDKQLSILENELVPYLLSQNGNFHIIDDTDLPSQETLVMEEKLKEVDQYIKNESLEKNKEENHGIDLLIIDHAQTLKFAKPTDNEYALINSYVNYFRKQSLSFLGEERQIVIILISQVNRDGLDYASKHGGEYKMHQLAEASEIERSSTYILTTYASKTSSIEKQIKVGAIKLRNASIPLEPINVPADGEHYRIGISSSSTVDTTANDYTVDDIEQTQETTSISSNLDEILGDLFKGGTIND